MSDTKTKKRRGFGVRLGEVFATAWAGYFRNIVPLSLAALATLAVYAPFLYLSFLLYEDGRDVMVLVANIAGAIVGGVVALPWYSYALDVVDGREIDLRKPFNNLGMIRAMLVAGFWFWAGFTFGMRYLLGIPAIFVLVLYAFHGFLIADGAADTGTMALGRSVKLTEGKRIGLFALAGLGMVFNLFGAFAIGYGLSPLTVAGTFAGLIFTTNITMLAGAKLYVVLEKEMA